MNPSGIRLGTPALTTRGLVESDILEVSKFMERVKDIAVGEQKKHGRKLTDFKKAVDNSTVADKLKDDIIKFMSQFNVPKNVSIDE